MQKKCSSVNKTGTIYVIVNTKELSDMKSIKTLAVTLGVGSALAWLMSNPARRETLRLKGKSALRTIKKLKTWEDDSDMRYI